MREAKLLNNKFREIEDGDKFAECVKKYFQAPTSELEPILKCSIEVSDEHIAYAHGEYKQDIAKFRVYLQSGDPDHYKRAGALLHALCVSQPIVKVNFDPDLQDVDTLATPLNVRYIDAEGSLGFGQFFNEYANEFVAFGMAYDICLQYEADVNPVQDFEFVHTMCVFLKNNNTSLNPEALFMMFKSLMLR